ncbi:MAG: dienelactone hydrolase family protein [Candidatus Marinimicrobia bacterium]|nr:dienelactone hydrolase family protein [Candidatus Neomarinimicrobiota bacterium]
MIFPVMAPFSDLPAPTGPYSVATHSSTWTDSSRDETFTAEKDYRRLVVQTWFPIANQNDFSALAYIDDPELRLPAIAKQLRLPLSLINHFGDVKTHATPTLPNLEKDIKFPVILFSHGLSGMRFQNTALIEELVSYGYVVFAADHSYGANITIFDDGLTAEYRAGKRRALNADFLNSIDLSQIEILVKDLRFILDVIKIDSSNVFFDALPMDTDRIGVMGHSLGGAVGITTMALDSRVEAAMVLDGWYAPIPDSVIATGLNRPIFHLGQKQWSEPGNYMRMDDMLSRSSGPVYKMLVPGTLHTDFTDMPLFTPFSLLIGYTKIQNPIWLNDLLRVNTAKFFDVYLKDYPESELRKQILSAKDVTSYIFTPLAP